MNRYFSPTTAQQAPTPFMSRHIDGSGPAAVCGTVQMAFSTPQSKNSIPHFRISRPSTTVTTEDGMELNRFTRAQPSGPTPAVSGGGLTAAGTGPAPAMVVCDMI
jgi:hypothetical protein